MKNLINKRNIINILGLISFALGMAVEMEIIMQPDGVKWALFGVALIGYITNDTIKLGNK